MKTLIIYAHPNHESLCYAFLQKVLEGCRDNLAVSEIQLLDLYAEGFDPVLVFNEKKRRRDMHTDPELAQYREQLSWAEQKLNRVYQYFRNTKHGNVNGIQI